jgi:chromosome segregation ATPase
MVLRSKKRSGRGYYLHPEDVALIRQIRQGYTEGRTSEEIDQLLRQSGIPLEVKVDNKEDSSQLILPAEAFMQIRNAMISMSEEMSALKEDLQKAHQEIHFLKEQQSHSAHETQEKLEAVVHTQNQELFTSLTGMSESLSRLEREKEDTNEQLESVRTQNQELISTLTGMSEGLSRLERERETREKQSFWNRLFSK